MSITTKQKALLDATFNAIPSMHLGFSDAKYILYQKALASEKIHRNGRGRAGNFSAHYAARYFAIKWLHEYATQGRSVTLRDYLHIREECFYAAALAEEFADQLKPWVASVPPEFFALDYADLMAG